MCGAAGGGLGKGGFDAQAAAGLRLDCEGRAVGVGDGPDYGQAKAEPLPVAGPVGAEPLEWLQQLVDGCRWHDGSGVGHRKHGVRVAGS